MNSRPSVEHLFLNGAKHTRSRNEEMLEREVAKLRGHVSELSLQLGNTKHELASRCTEVATLQKGVDSQKRQVQLLLEELEGMCNTPISRKAAPNLCTLQKELQAEKLRNAELTEKYAALSASLETARCDSNATELKYSTLVKDHERILGETEVLKGQVEEAGAKLRAKDEAQNSVALFDKFARLAVEHQGLQLKTLNAL